LRRRRDRRWADEDYLCENELCEVNVALYDEADAAVADGKFMVVNRILEQNERFVRLNEDADLLEFLDCRGKVARTIGVGTALSRQLQVGAN
jgi:hypothetical protein